MRTVLVCGGMPRSGTTYAARMLSQRYRLSASLEEPRYLMSSQMVGKIITFTRELYEEALKERVGLAAEYSAWGSVTDFTTNFSIYLPIVLSAICRRDILEEESIDQSYLAALSLLREKSFGSLIDQDQLLKQPNAEINWREIDKMFPSYNVYYFICMREPYSVYSSMVRLGWIQGMHEFLELLRNSYQATIALQKAKRCIISQLDRPEEFDVSLHKVGSLFSIGEQSAQLEDNIDPYWQNRGKETQQVDPSDSFYYFFGSYGCAELRDQIDRLSSLNNEEALADNSTVS